MCIRDRSWCHADSPHAAESRLSIRAIEPGRGASRDPCEQGVMRGFAGTGTKLHGAHPFVFLQTGWDREIAKNVRAAGGQIEAYRHLKNQIRLTQVPALGELGKLRHLRNVA